MNSFEKWWSEYWKPNNMQPVFNQAMREVAQNAYIAGLRRVAEMAREYQRAGARIHDSNIEAEATHTETEKE